MPGTDEKNDEIPRDKRRGKLRNGNPSGDFSKAKRCGARNRRGTACQCPAMRNGRCRLHGGLSTGPKTREGLERIRRAVTKHGMCSKEAKVEHPRVAVFGEGVALLWAKGKRHAAIRVEQLCNDLGKTHDVDILCAYPVSGFHSERDKQAFKAICADHSAVYSP